MVTEAGDRPVILFNPRLARYFASLLTLHKNARKWDLCCAHPVLARPVLTSSCARAVVMWAWG